MEELQDEFCFLCKKRDTTLFDICYTVDTHSAKQSLGELYGDMVETYIRNEDIVCLSCVQILQNTVNVKRSVFEVIVDNAVSKEIHGKPGSKPFNFADTWSITYDHLPESASPNNLLVITGSIPYKDRCDSVDRSLSRYGYGCDTPGLDREVQRVTSRSRYRRRGHKWTRKKGSQSRSNSVYSRSASRYSHASRTSRTSRTTVNSTGSRATSIKKKHLQQSLEKRLRSIVGDFFYQSDTLNRFTREYLKKYINDNDEYFDPQNSPLPEAIQSTNGMSIKTRFACEMRDKLISEYQELIHECPYNSCGVTFFTLEHITEHRVKIHNDMAMFLCEQCKFYYLTQDDLEKHRDLHFKRFVAYCIYCSEEYRNKRLYEQHLNDHLIHSFPCIYCDKFFLRKQQRENHIKEKHPGMNKKVKRIKPQSILDRIDKKPKMDEVPMKTPNESQEFTVKVLCQHGQPEEPKLIEDDLDEIDISNDENLCTEDDITCS